MKKSTFVFVKNLLRICLFWSLALHIRSQPVDNSCWQRQISPSFSNLLSPLDLFFIDASTGWVVNVDGGILRTTDGGATWQFQTDVPGNNALLQIHFTDNQTGWVVGQKGTIVHTSNGGTTWEIQESGTTADLYSVQFVDSQVGWVVGGDGILHTSDGGELWELQSTNGVSAIYFTDSQTGWAVGPSGVIFHTTNAGADWQQQPSVTSDHLTCLHFIDNMTGWAAGRNGAIVHTEDGGSSWEQQISGTVNNIISLHFTDSLTGWAADAAGKILSTTDGGTTWQQQPIRGALLELWAVHFLDSQTGWALGYDNLGATGLLYHSSDGGATWEVQAANYIKDLHFVDSQTGWAVGVLNILYTSNGGATWYDQTPTEWFSTFFEEVHFTDTQTGWVTGVGDTILHTSNGGISWDPQPTGVINGISDIYFTDNQTGWLCGGSGEIHHTVNGGASWQQQSSGASNTLIRIHFTDSLTGWVVGNFGTILHTTNGGITWQPQSSGTSKALLDVHFTDNLTGWVVGDSSTILHTIDGGLTWQPQVSGFSSVFTGVHFIDSNRGWIVETFGSILYTLDGGKNWHIQFLSEYAGWESFEAIYFADSETGWVAGGSGAWGGVILAITPACISATNTLSGLLFHDSADCLPDSTDRPLAQWLVKAEGAGQTFYAITDTAGHFSMLLDTGTYALSAIPPNGLWAPCDTILLNISQLDQNIDTSIGVQAIIDCPLLDVDIATPFLRRCFDNFYRVSYCNEGTAAAENAYVELYFDAFLDVDTASLPDPWTDLGGNGFRVGLGDIQAGDCGAFSVKVNVNCDSTGTGEVKCVEARIFPDTICYPVPGWDGSNIIVRSACQGDSVQFRIINTGADMSGPEEYIIIEDVVLREDVFQLPAGEDTVIAVPVNNGFVRLEAEQDPEHPFSRIASATSEGCPEFIQPTGFLQFPQDEASPFVAVDCHQIVSSFDPNDKSASPQGLGDEHAIRDNTPLEYRIRFQNTGTDTAFTVILRDTLSPFLDPATVRPGAASHPYRFDMSGNGILKFTYENIMLPDSNVNEPASHGFVQFSIAQKSSPVNPPGTVIKNEAAIYFDYNAPVLTNTFFHTVTEPVTAIFRDTVCDPAAGDVLLSDTAQFSYYEVIRETLFADTIYATLDTAVALGDTIFGVVVLSPVTVVKTLTSVNGCDSILQVSITIPATEPAGALPFQLFPNPTRGDLILRFTPGKEEKIEVIEVFDARGRLKRVILPPAGWNGKDAMTLRVSGLPGGVYFITVYGQKETWAGRFVKLD